MFTLVNNVLLRPLAVDRPHELATLSTIPAVTDYRVAQRRSELGIRMAIGSTPGAVLRLVLLETLRVVGVGVLLGVTMSLWSGQIIASLLYGVTPREPLIIAGAAIVMLVAGLVSACGPAYRASVTDPTIVLRHPCGTIDDAPQTRRLPSFVPRTGSAA